MNLGDNKNEKIIRSVIKLPTVLGVLAIIFTISIITVTVSLIVYIWLLKNEIIYEHNLCFSFITVLLCSIASALVLIKGFGKRVVYSELYPITELTKEASDGMFSQRIYVPKDKYVAKICKSLNDMLDSLDSNELIARDFLSNVSHQFRTPLASIRGYAQLLESGDLSESERLEYIGIIEEKAMALSELVTDILELSRLEHQSADITKEYFQVDEQIRKCLLAMENRISEKNIEVELTLNSVKLLGNKELLKEVWMNLLENAIKFSETGGMIKISLDSSFDNLVFVIADNGIGMSLETSLKMCDRFYRGAEAADYYGSGLGMSMVKDIVTKHDGTISVKSEIGKGSEFTVTLPLE